uniref:Bardet-Biedl syndrome 4 protein n=1 Tax=Phallusia mammillata TaxID=59560 RepID=A0A6F9D895_9ASCI|nr:Bardet-Biedl syndrome 4 protein [Phallusia mammillata]
MSTHSETTSSGAGEVKAESESEHYQPPTLSVAAGPKRKIKARKAAKLPSIERRNWLIHSHFIRKEFDGCKSLIQEQLVETNGQCEYAIYIQALMLRSDGEIQQSLELFQACHQINPKNPDNMKQIAKNLILLGKHKSAIECYNHATDLGERDWEICHCLGVCYQFLKQLDQAEQCFLEALSKGKHTVTYSVLAKLYLEQQETKKAIDILQKGVDFAPENTDLLTSLGLLHLRNESFHRAFELLGQALTYDPENYKAILAAGSLMQKHGDFDVALTKYRVAAQRVPESSSLWNNIAMCFFGKKKNVAAISCLKRANYLSPFDWRILYNLSLLHLTMQQYASAFQFASTAIGLKSDHGPLYMLLAVGLANLGQDDNAEQAYLKAMELNSNDPHTLINYCVFLHNRGNSQKAANILGNFHKLSDDKSVSVEKELFEISKRLSAVLNVGEKIVVEKEKVEKHRKKKATKKTESVSSLAEMEQQNHIEEQAAPSGNLKPKKLAPLGTLSSVSSPSTLPPLRSPMGPLNPSDLLSQMPAVPEHDPERRSTKHKQPVAE